MLPVLGGKIKQSTGPAPLGVLRIFDVMFAKKMMNGRNEFMLSKAAIVLMKSSMIVFMSMVIVLVFQSLLSKCSLG